MSTLDRRALAAKFLAALRDASLSNRDSWRRIRAISARTGITGVQLELAIYDLVTAGLVEQHVDDAGLVILTDKGWATTNN